MTSAIVNQVNASPQAQTSRLAQYMEQGKSITPLDAWHQLGIYRLSARVFELRQRGVNVRGEYVTVFNQFDEPCRVMSYSLGEVA